MLECQQLFSSADELSMEFFITSGPDHTESSARSMVYIVSMSSIMGINDCTFQECISLANVRMKKSLK